MAIHLLSEQTINKIAAGEVIERPASVVKELLENSIDAGSTFIEIDIRNYGKELIRVSDNGCGMEKDDAVLSLQRHATSKILDENDLSSIATLGFRGEALASIASVSKTIIITRKQGFDEGTRVEAEGGNILFIGTAGSQKGTTVEVHNLFFNTPARMKFLKQDSMELKAIADVVTRYALLYTNIAFRLVHNEHSLLSTAASDDFLNNIVSIYGKDSAKQMIKIDFSNNIAEVKGYVSKPSLLKNDRGYQSIYVNGRYVKDDIVTQALYDAYHSLLFVNKHPLAVLSIKVNPAAVDVNVHPAKSFVKFSQPVKVYEAVFEAIRNALREHSLITDYAVKEENVPMSRFSNSFAYTPLQQNTIPVQQNIVPMQQAPAQEKAAAIPAASSFSEVSANEVQNTLVNSNESTGRIALSQLPSMRVLGQIAKTYFLAETDDGFLLIDQHVVQERAYYEKFMSQLMRGNVAKQELLSPAVIEFTPAEYSIIHGSKELISSMGFETEEFGTNTFMLRTIPSVFGRLQPKELLTDLLEELSNDSKTSIDKLKESIITRMACKASIKGGDDCSIPEFIPMLKELDKCSMPWTCPHGRPIFIKFSKDEIEKMFRRKG